MTSFIGYMIFNMAPALLGGFIAYSAGYKRGFWLHTNTCDRCKIEQMDDK